MTEQGFRVDIRDDGKDMAHRVGAVWIAQACTDEGLSDLGEFGYIDCVEGRCVRRFRRVMGETAAYRIRTATQLLESFAFEEGVHSDLARVLVTSLRDGCDLMDVVGRRLQKQVLG